jgi:hypothetical protein
VSGPDVVRGRDHDKLAECFSAALSVSKSLACC